MKPRSLRIIAALATLDVVLSCSGADGIAPTTSTQPGAITRASDSTLLAGLYASAPVAGGYISPDRIGASGSAASGNAAPSTEVSWVSLVPGTVPDGTTATIVNLRTTQRITSTIVDGGFDPQPIPASLGDTIQVSVSRAGKPETAAVMSLAARPGPRIVRSRPPRGQTDAPLNTIITLVFSEPLASSSVNPSTVTLTTAASPVAGSVRLLPGPGYVVEFTPDTLLAPLTTYALTVSGVATLAGTPLAAPTSISFATGTTVGPDSVVSVTISPNSATVRAGDTLQLFSSVTYVSGYIAAQSVDYVSSAPDVAYIDVESQTVTGVGPGTAVITGYSNYGATGTARITVIPSTIPVGAIVGMLCSNLDGEIAVECGLYAVDPDGSKGRFITSGDDIDPVWSPDGRWIAFNSQRACNPVTVRFCHNDLYVMRGDGSGIGSDGSGLRSLTAGVGLDVGGASWSPDGSRLVFAATPFPTELYLPEALYVVNADGSGLQRILSAPPGSSASEPDWSPDGRRIVYIVSVPVNGDSSEIHVVNADGTNDVRILVPPSESFGAFRPRWSPDSKRIAFTSLFQVFVMNADGSNLLQVTNDSRGAWSPAWSPDGSRLALISPALRGLGVINTDGTGGTSVPGRFSGQDLTKSAISWRRTAAAVPVPAQSRAAQSTDGVRP